MRVIAGTAKKMILKSPRGEKTRPTADRVKEAVFNILADRIIDCNFLDLFAGTGSIAIEALSRGAAHAVLVEKDRPTVAIIKENLQRTKLFQRAEILHCDVFSAMKTLYQNNKNFDIIYIDPPYYKGYYQKVLNEVFNCHLLSPKGVVVVESSTQHLPPETVADLLRIRTQRYGDTTINFYQLT